MEVKMEAKNEEKLMLPTSESLGSIVGPVEMRTTAPLALEGFSMPLPLHQNAPSFLTLLYSQLCQPQEQVSSVSSAVESDILELQTDSEPRCIETEVAQQQEFSVATTDEDSKGNGDYSDNFLRSGDSDNRTVGSAPEEPLREPFKGFFTEDQDNVQSLIQYKLLKLTSMTNGLQKGLKKSVIAVAKERNGVLPIRKEYPKVSLLYKRFVPAPPPLQLESQRSRNHFARPVQLFKPLQEAKDKVKMEEEQVGLEEEGWLPKKSGLAPSSRCGRSILPPKKYSSGGVVLMQEKAQNDKRSRKWKKNHYEIGLLPPKYPKRMEHSLNRVSDYGYCFSRQFENMEEAKGTASLMFDRIANDSLFQISAIIQSGELQVDSLQRFLEQIKNQTSKMNEDKCVDDVVDGPTHDVDFKPALPSIDDEEMLKADRNDRKKVIIVGKKNGMNLCSILCHGRRGRIPTLQCIKCLCLVHAECVGVEYSDLLSYSDFICQNCHKVMLLRERAKITLNPPTTPAPIPPPSSKPLVYSPVPKSPNVNLLNERRKLIKKPPIPKLLPLKFLPIPKPTWNILSPPSVGLRRGRGFGGKNKIPVIPIPQLKPYLRPVKLAPRPKEDDFLEYLNLSNGALTVSLVNSPPAPSSPYLKQNHKTSLSPPSAPESSSPFKIPTGRAPQAAAAKNSCTFVNGTSIFNEITITKVPSPPKPGIGAGMNRNFLP